MDLRVTAASVCASPPPFRDDLPSKASSFLCPDEDRTNQTQDADEVQPHLRPRQSMKKSVSMFRLIRVVFPGHVLVNV